jgi:hypothetical protein
MAPCLHVSYVRTCFAVLYYTSVLVSLSSHLPLQTRVSFFLLIEKVLTDCFRFEPRFGVCLDTDLLIQVACYLDPWCFPSSIFSFYLFFTWFWQPSSAERLSLSKSHKPFKKRTKIQLYNAENDLPSRGYFTLFFSSYNPSRQVRRPEHIQLDQSWQIRRRRSIWTQLLTACWRVSGSCSDS